MQVANGGPDEKMKLTPDQGADKLIANLSNAGTAITNGVNGVQQAPTAAAAAQVAKMKARINAALDNGSWAAGLNKVTLDQWKQSMLTKGVPRIATGITAARAKLVAFNSKLYPFIDQSLQTLQSMPSATPVDMKNRMIAWFDKMSTFNKNL